MAKHFVSNKDESVRMFDADWMDVFSRIDYKVPLFIYIPLIIYFLYLSVVSVSLLYILPLIILGIVVWTFAEYNLHRFVFHWMPPGELGRKIHFTFHGVHHDYPRDSKRLVMVPAISLPLAVLFYFMFKVLLTWAFGDTYLVYPFFVGFVIGYLFYDMTHYALHHVNFKSKFWIDLKQHHMIHHYSDPENGFGVSTKFWDHVYRTMFNRPKQGASVVINEKELE
jgi:sterol desaturase/sphingolipid hydroxylase (fatty acid hydroxylase superfamily)